MSAVLVGLDVGTSSVKGLAVDEHGTVLAAAEEPHPLATPRPGWSEQDPEDWVRGTDQVLAALRAQTGAPTAIGLSGQMHGLVVLDERDAVVRPALLWNDQRTAAEAQEVEALVGGREALVGLTANRSMTGFTAPKLRWLARHEPEAHARVRRVLLPKDHVRLRLCGEAATDVADASGTGWFDPAARDWSAPVLEALGVDRAWLPPALESPALSGRTPDGVPVAAGAGDQGAGAVGVGAIGTGPDARASVVLGTSGVVLASLGTPTFDPAARVQASAHATPGAWFAMGVILSAAGSLRWLRDVLDAPYETLFAEAERWGPGADGLTFLPYLTGERTPHADPAARGSFSGLEIRHDRGALVRAVLDGVALALRDALDLVGPVAVARVSGGGGRSELWLRIVAAALGVPLERIAVDEGAAYGAALLGGVSAGVWASVPEAVGACVDVRSTVEPDPAWVARYDELRTGFRALYPALHPAAARAA